MTAPGLHLHGDRELIRMFDRLPRRVTQLTMTKSLSAAGGVYKREAAQKVRTENLVLTGMLQKSMTVKVAKRRRTDKRMTAVGPKHRTYMVNLSRPKMRPIPARGTFKQHLAIQKAFSSGAKLVKVNPGKYAHLVEFGHGGPRPAQPHPFMRPAFATGIRGAQGAFKKMFINGLRHDVKKYNLKKR